MAVTIDLSPDTGRRLDELIKRSGRPRSEVLELIIANGLEDFEDLLAAEAVLRRIESGESEIISSEELGRRLGLED